MNIFVYCNVQLWQAHHAEALEIALAHIASNDQVFMGYCNQDLSTCPANASHSLGKCIQCKNNSNYALNTILSNKVIPVPLNLSQAFSETSSENLLEFENFDQLLQYREGNIPWGSLIASQLVDDLQDCFADLKPFKYKIASMLENGKALYTVTRKILSEFSIDKVYFWNGRRISDGPVYYAARDAEVCSEAYISGGKSGTYMTISAPTVMDLNENKKRIQNLLVNSGAPHDIAQLSEDAIDFFYAQRYGGTYFPGSVTFSKTFQRTDVTALNKSRKVLVLFSSSYWEFLAVETFAGGVYHDHYQGIRQILTDENINQKYLIVIRWHPNLRNCGCGERAVIDEISLLGASSGATVYPPESEADSYTLLEKADVVVTFGSTIGAEASYYGKPTILLGHSWYEDLNVCYTPKTHAELVLLLNQNLQPLPVTGSIVYGYYMRNFGNNFFKHLSIDTDYRFRYKQKEIHPRNYFSELKRILGNLVKKIFAPSKKL